MLNISFTSPEVFKNFAEVELHSKMTDLLLWISKRFVNGLSQIVVTSAYRPAKIYEKDSGIHSTKPLRAVDLRHWAFSDAGVVVRNIQANWVYDPGRPLLQVCLLHDVGQGLHFHLQVSDKTILREREVVNGK